jgi:DNA-binding CsgD family transcriptional regulator/sugar-specific transcriptional regulator TrmB
VRRNGEGNALTLTVGAPDTATVPGQRAEHRPVASPSSAAPGLQLTHLGLDPFEEAAYRAALERPLWTIAEFALRVGAPVPDVARVVVRLAELDLVRTEAGGGRLRPANPQLALTALIARREAEMVSAWHELERGRLAAASLAADFESAQRAHLDGALDVAHGPEAVRARIAALVSQARTEVLSLMLSGCGYVDPIAAPRRADLAAPAPGVRVRVVAPDRARHDPLPLRHLHGVAADGAEVRTAAEVPMSALVVDRVAAVFPLASTVSRNRVGAVVLRLPSVVTTTVELFERVWPEAIPLGEMSAARDTPGEREQVLLSLMLTGCTDEAAAGRLNVSVRTVRRMVSDLTERLGARGRFQAGALAAERGWITTQMLRDAAP